jgi:retron-type reverse transcriptase
MRTYKHLFEKISSFDNLLDAYSQAAKGKKERKYVMQFTQKLEENIFGLQKELISQTYQPGDYSTFNIYYPKTRMISAAPFRDRIVHHALINIIGPLMEKSFIFDSYANRIGKGTHKAIKKYQDYLCTYNYVLKCDIKKYFPSIDHEILKELLRRKIRDKKTLWLIDSIIDASNPQEKINNYFPGDDIFTPFQRKRGLPIGNLTSQTFANYYLNPLDHFIKENLKCMAYLRYVDDFVLFNNSKVQLMQWEKEIENFLFSFRLQLNGKRRQLYPAIIGTGFLGQKIFKSHRRLTGENVRRFKKRLRSWSKNPPNNLRQRIDSWIGHAKQANTQKLIEKLKPQIQVVFAIKRE